MTQRLLHLMALVSSFVFLFTPNLEARSYIYQDLGVVGENYSEAWGVNNLGDVVGFSKTADDASVQAFLWTTNGHQMLGSLYGGISKAYGINDYIDVVGESDGRAFLWSQEDGMSDLGVLEGQSSSVAKSINNKKQAIGYSSSSTQRRAFLWSSKKGMEDIGTLGGNFAEANGINEQNQIVGESTPLGGHYHACWWQKRETLDLGTLGGVTSFANDINKSKQVVGWANIPSGYVHAFLWERGIMQDLGTLGTTDSLAYAINDMGEVVGEYKLTDQTGEYHPGFLWTKNSGMVDLNDLVVNLPPGVMIGRACDINNDGWIVGYTGWNIYTGSIPGYGHHAYLLIPLD